MGLTLISPLQGFRFIKPKPRVALRSTLGYLIPPRWGFGRVDRLLHGVVAEAWRGNIGVAFFRVGFPPWGIGLKCPFGGLWGANSGTGCNHLGLSVTRLAGWGFQTCREKAACGNGRQRPCIWPGYGC